MLLEDCLWEVLFGTLRLLKSNSWFNMSPLNPTKMVVLILQKKTFVFLPIWYSMLPKPFACETVNSRTIAWFSSSLLISQFLLVSAFLCLSAVGQRKGSAEAEKPL